MWRWWLRRREKAKGGIDLEEGRELANPVEDVRGVMMVAAKARNGEGL